MKLNTYCLVVSALLTYFAPTLKVEAVVPPPPGGYPNFTTAAGDHALQALTLGVGNTALGTFSLFSVTTGNFNTAVGAGALDLNTADSNTATGAAALLFNTTGTENTANGTAALEFNETGSNNTASGAFALFSNTTGANNTAVGTEALLNNIGGPVDTPNGDPGAANTAVGARALASNTIGSFNTASGYRALEGNTTGSFNAATGHGALTFNTTGSLNTAIGPSALSNNAEGNSNTAIGANALLSNTGSGNIALGANAGSFLTTGNNNIDIGNTGVAFESDTIRLGSEFQTRTFIAAIRGVTTGIADAVNVVIDSNGQLGTMSSSRRFKKEIKPMDSASEAILALKPVTFHYNSDKTDTPQFGLIAEEVADVNPDLVVCDEKGEIYSVRYDAVNAMLLNEFLKEHRKNEEQGATIAQQQKDIEALKTELKEQASQIQKVSAQLELRESAPRTVLNNQ